MSPLKKLTLRILIYGGVLGYIAGDLFLFHGPISRKIESANPSSTIALSAAKSRGVVARVFNHQITRDQLDRAVAERLWLEGKTLDDIPGPNRKTLRYAALGDLIDHELLRVKAKAHAPKLLVTEDEINQLLRLLLARFESRDAMESAMKSQGIPDETALRNRVAARIQQEKYVDSKIAPLAEVTEQESREWFDKNAAKLAHPPRAKVRHIFLPTLDHKPADAKATLEAALTRLTSGAIDFPTLASQLSEDPATKTTGGDLGWMSQTRLPADFATPVFQLPLHQPTLIRTTLGYHIVEVTDRKPAQPRSYQDAKPEIIAAIRAIKRHQAATEYRTALRRFEAEKIDIHHDMLAD
ncbi:MAG: peptidylprolyl isomerase [Verrucomicrobiota bacterium JB025]|nr:peptidylprolyl isomerase [Verrucomicrobiota bacterium JB025]